MSRKSQIKIGVRQGGGEPPGYAWSVGIIDFIFEESIKVVAEPGYTHLAMQMRELAMQSDPTRSESVDVRPIEDFYEIRDKGAPFGGANVRLFFGVDANRRSLIPLGVIKKQNNGKTPEADKIKMRRRWRKYLNGEFGTLAA